MRLFKKILNTAVADLRKYDETALNKYKMINAATVILPENPTPEFMQAYSSINVNCAKTMYYSDSKQIYSTNGVGYYDDSSLSDDVLYFLNGIAVINSVNKIPEICVNGIVILSNNAKVKIQSINGMNVKCYFDIEHYKCYTSDFYVDKEFVEYVDDNTVILSSGKLTFDADINLDILKNKQILFVSSGDVIAPKDLMPIVKLKSYTTGKLKIND